jgi:hypothetical protein
MITLMRLAVTKFHIVHPKSSLPVQTQIASHWTSIVMELITAEITQMNLTVPRRDLLGMNVRECSDVTMVNVLRLNGCVTKRTTVVMALMRLILVLRMNVLIMGYAQENSNVLTYQQSTNVFVLEGIESQQLDVKMSMSASNLAVVVSIVLTPKEALHVVVLLGIPSSQTK